MAAVCVHALLKSAKIFSNFSVILGNTAKLNFACSIISVREKHGIRKWKIRDNHWVPRKRVFCDDRLTAENKEFLQEVIHDTFLKPGESPLKQESHVERPVWTPNSRRTGVIARKIGLCPIWTKNGTKVITTLLQVVDNHVIRYNPPELFAESKFSKKYKEKESYGSLVVGAESSDPQLYSAAYNGLFVEAGVMPKKKITRFRITPDAVLPPGTPLYATHFRPGDYVNVFGITTYHGFQGVVKRWGMKGGPASHGCTKSHRRPGCVGGGRKNGIWKGSKMPGLMGGYRRLMVGLKIWRINTKYNVIYVHGRGVPGVVNNYCYIYDCKCEKKNYTESNPPPFPTFFPQDAEEPIPEELYDSNLHVLSDPTIVFSEESGSSK